MQDARPSQVPFPERVGRYEVLLPVASGGMATVYLARARGAGGFERDVALKLTHAHLRESSEFAHELLEEGKLVVRIRHANVVPVLDLGDDPQGLFLVMEYIEGDTLSGLLRRAAAAGSPLDPAVSLRILLDALAGLHAAHELTDDDGRHLGLVHRDFSPQNILVGTDGVGRLADFGIAKAATRLGATRTGTVKGKIAYMAPEQARGLAVDRRCDVWAAGVLAWELIAGRRLYASSGDEIGTLFRIATEVPPRLSSVFPEVSPALDEAVAHALTPDLAARAPTAAAFARQLSQALRASSIELVETSDVAAVVGKLIGPKLAERRSRVKEVLALRSELGRVARSTTSEISTPGSSILGPRAARDESLGGAEPTTAVLGLPSAPATEPSRTDVSAVSTGAQLALLKRPRSRTLLLAAGAGVALLVAAFGVRWLVTDAPPSTAAQASEPASAPPASASRASTSTSTPTAVATASDPVAPAESSPPPASSSSSTAKADKPKARAPAAVRAPPRRNSFLDQQH